MEEIRLCCESNAVIIFLYFFMGTYQNHILTFLKLKKKQTCTFNQKKYFKNKNFLFILSIKQFLSYRKFSSVKNANKTPITNFLKYNLIVSLYKDIIK